MKKIVLSLFAVLMLSACASIPTVNQLEVYGEVEDVVYLNGHHKHKVWCKAKEKYYYVISDKLYQPGEVIRIF